MLLKEEERGYGFALVMGCVRYLIDLGFDLEKNSAADLLNSVAELLFKAVENDDLLDEIEKAYDRANFTTMH